MAKNRRNRIDIRYVIVGIIAIIIIIIAILSYTLNKDKKLNRFEALAKDTIVGIQRIVYYPFNGISNLISEYNDLRNVRKENEKYKSLEKTLNDTLLLAQETSANAQKAAYAQSKLIVEDARNNASKIVNNSLIKAQNIEREAEELQRKVISYKKRFIALVESQVDEMDKFDERL